MKIRLVIITISVILLKMKKGNVMKNDKAKTKVVVTQVIDDYEGGDLFGDDNSSPTSTPALNDEMITLNADFIKVLKAMKLMQAKMNKMQKRIDELENRPAPVIPEPVVMPVDDTLKNRLALVEGVMIKLENRVDDRLEAMANIANNAVKSSIWDLAKGKLAKVMMF